MSFFSSHLLAKVQTKLLALASLTANIISLPSLISQFLPSYVSVGLTQYLPNIFFKIYFCRFYELVKLRANKNKINYYTYKTIQIQGGKTFNKNTYPSYSFGPIPLSFYFSLLPFPPNPKPKADSSQKPMRKEK